MTESQPPRGRCWIWDTRSPRWRWRLARGGELRHPSYPEDDTVRAARAYVRYATQRPFRCRYRPYFPAVQAALDLRLDDPLLKAEVEAHVLVGRSPAWISSRVNRPPEQIEAYERLFFDVRDRLDNQRWLEWYVVGAHEDLGSYDVGKLWKYFAFLGGEFGLDAVLEDFRLSGRPDYSHYFREPPEAGRDNQRAIVQLAILERILPRPQAAESKRLLLLLAARRPVTPLVSPEDSAAERLTSLAAREVAAAPAPLPVTLNSSARPDTRRRATASTFPTPSQRLTRTG